MEQHINSLRVRIALSVILIFLPVFVLIGLTAEDYRRFAIDEAQEDSLTLARAIASDNLQYIESTHHLLIALAQLPFVRDQIGAVCDNTLEQILNEYEIYSNLFVIDVATGQLACSARPLSEAVDYAETDWYQAAVRTQDFVISEYRVSSGTGQPAVTMAHPIRHEDGEITGVVAAGLSLRWFNTFTRNTSLSSETSITFIDNNGIVMARYPIDEGAIGQPYMNETVRELALTGEEATIQSTGPDGQQRLYAYTTVGPDSGHFHVIVGTLESVALADAQAIAARNLAILSGITLLVAVLGWVSGGLITRPIKSLTDVSRQIAEGQLSSRTLLNTPIIELQQLVTAFNDMAASVEESTLQRVRQLNEANERLQREIEERARAQQAAEQTANQLVHLQSVTSALSQALTVEQIAQVTVDQGVEVLQAASGSLHLVADDGESFVMVYNTPSRLPVETQTVWQQYPAEPDYPAADVLRTGEALWFSSAEALTALYPTMAALAEIYPGATALLPLQVSQQVIGHMSISFLRPHEFSQQDRIFLFALAYQAAQAIHRAQLSEQAKEASAMEERQRLARELHDSVSQSLFSATAIAETVPRIWERDQERAMQHLQQVITLNRGAMAEMRTLLLELRPEAILNSPLKDLLTQLVQAARARAPIEASLVVQGDVEPLPPAAHMALYRIAQESIHNALKHSSASQLIIELTYMPARVRLQIADNGQGFDASRTHAGLGLGSMRERAEQIHAEFQIISADGDGTTVVVLWHQPE